MWPKMSTSYYIGLLNWELSSYTFNVIHHGLNLRTFDNSWNSTLDPSCLVNPREWKPSVQFIIDPVHLDSLNFIDYLASYVLSPRGETDTVLFDSPVPT